jgi:hypothetical protein
MDRIQRPDTEAASSLQGKTYQGAGTVNIKDAALSQSTFGATKKTGMKEFAGMKSFLGIKNPWFGSRTFDSREAWLGSRGGAAALDKSYEVRDASVGRFSGSSKQASLGSPVVPVRPFLDKGAAPNSVGQFSEKIKKEMTIDEVRELLNKPR